MPSGRPLGAYTGPVAKLPPQWSGSIEGAIEAGERTAAEVIGQLSNAGLLRRNA
jgi:monoamine oxidase